MGKWTLDKELEDTAKAAGSGYSMGVRKEKADTPSPTSNPNGMSNAEVEGGALYKRGGFVGGRASGKRNYSKGKK